MASQGSSPLLEFFILEVLLLQMHMTVTELTPMLPFFSRKTPPPFTVSNSYGLLSVYYRPDIVFATYGHFQPTNHPTR